jgi:hypothetical protein
MEVLPQLGKFSLSTIDIKKRVYKFFGVCICVYSGATKQKIFKEEKEKRE